MADDVKAGFWYCQGSPQDFSNISTPIHFTHLFCAFANISSDFHVTIPIEYQDTFSRFTKEATKINSNVKTLMSIGGVGSDPAFFRLLSHADNRRLFIQSSIALARNRKFHGLDLCCPWEPPITDMDMIMTNLDRLLTEWHQAIVDDANKNKGMPPLLLSATVFYRPTIDNSRYPIDAISKYLNWINVRAYDFYVPSLSPATTGPPAPLHNLRDATKCVEASIRAWIEAGVPPNKLVLGLPFVGFQWLLTDPNNQNGLFAPASGPPPGTGDGHKFYRDMANVTDHKFDEDYVTDYFQANNIWTGYDDTDIIIRKIQYAKKMTLRGYFGWHVGADEPNRTLSRKAFEKWDNPGQDDQ